ncbi:MAG: prolyl oligopeptidase family serine peptidase [Phycisphaerae bacterium]|nr:prolyl oligopeptidase family serine peptidase [Phycisphaerae bacterium]
MTALQKRFEKLWLDRSRRSEIGITLKRYRRALAGLRRAPAKPRPPRCRKLRHILHLPAGYPGRKRWPLMMFLHGAGERGDDLSQVAIYGPPKIAKKDKHFPFIVVAPQCPADRWWCIDDLLGLLDEVTAGCAVDRDRVYLTGMSMGGFGTWVLAARAPRRFAAIAPICGGGDPATARRLKDVPIWAFHGARDQTVPLRQSQQMVEAVRQIGGKAKLTVYPSAGHDSWTATYANPRLYTWMLKHRRKPARGRTRR